MPDNDEHDPLENWLNQQVRPLPPPPGTFKLITRRARRRRLRRAAITVTAGATVAAGVVIAATNPTLRLATPSESGQVAAGSHPSGTTSQAPGTQQPNGSGVPAHSPAASPSASAGQPFPGPVPADFAPSSVTFVSSTRAWVIGQAGAPGACYNGSICTSVAWTSDGGGTWHGEHAPVTGAASGPDGVSGIRFLDGVNGWAFGPELWATHDAGGHWRRVGTSGHRVTDLEAVGDRAYALFANCSGASGAGFAADCTRFTLMTATADSDSWTPVGPATTGMATGSTGPRTDHGGLATGGAPASAMLALTGSAGYLVAPNGTLYSGPLDGAWHPVAGLSCTPGAPARASGLPPYAQLAPASGQNLALACSRGTSGPPAIYTSSDGGATWTQMAASAWTGVSGTGTMTSFAAAPDGTLALATTTGIYVAPAGSSQWKTATASGGDAMPSKGFSYVGMTSDTQGVALPSDTSLHEIWITTDSGQTWLPRPIH